MMEVWLNGQPLTRKYLSKETLKGQPIITLGQEQDSHGGAFDINQSFVGMMTDVHMWGYVLSPCEIHNYMKEAWFTPGNVVNWRDLNFLCIGNVFIEDRQLSISA
uniref:Pentraxin (PTX) domain-containing protein n=1 Tax=Knipowitschia caucasica TaxID=637954 RepID=A0AAV2KA72_KNICA